MNSLGILSKIQNALPAVLALLLATACGSQGTIPDSVRARKPAQSQNDGPRTGSSNSQAGETQTTSADPTIKRFAYDANQLRSATQRMSGIDFDYAFGITSIHPTSPNIRVKLTNPELIKLGSNLGVVIAGYPMSESSSFVSSNTAISLDSNGLATIKGENFKPATVYKLRVHFFDLTVMDQAQSQPRYLGASTQSYQMVTDGENDPLASSRARIVMRGFGEVHDWSLGRYDRQKGYTQHSGGGWCHVFYNWVIKNDLKTRSGSQNTHYDSNYWSSLKATISGNELLSLSQKEMIHGDYFRVGSHAAMIIAYDKSRSEFVTLEGNFNNSVQMYRRRASDMSWVGHITRDMLR